MGLLSATVNNCFVSCRLTTVFPQPAVKLYPVSQCRRDSMLVVIVCFMFFFLVVVSLSFDQYVETTVTGTLIFFFECLY